MQYTDTILKEISHRLQSAGVFSSRLEARIILSEVLKIPTSDIIFCHRYLTTSEEHRLNDLLQRRISGEPLCKILGNKDFYRYNFIVNDKVLSPRADTEVLLEAAIFFAKQISKPKVLELGVGSGCIMLSILSDIKDAYGIGIDISSDAIDICKKNAKKLGVMQRCELKNISWFAEDIISYTGADYDIIVTNPPYIPSGDISRLDREVREHDPLLALDGGEDGFVHYRHIAKISPFLLKNDGQIFIEAGINQADEIASIFSSAGLRHVSIVPDTQGIGRCVILKK